jgi:uncharacterized membrane protein
MWRTSSIFPASIGMAAILPKSALAQAQNPPWETWFGPWPMWGGWSSWWWVCPLMMVVMMLVMMFACRFMGSWHRD